MKKGSPQEKPFKEGHVIYPSVTGYKAGGFAFPVGPCYHF
jgi:hypothetical protein